MATIIGRLGGPFFFSMGDKEAVDLVEEYSDCPQSEELYFELSFEEIKDLFEIFRDSRYAYDESRLKMTREQDAALRTSLGIKLSDGDE